jgi:hypothetical protein
VDPESQVREVLLKDKFLTQSAPDICKKLKICGWKEKVIEPSNTASHVWDLTNRREKDKRHHDLIAAPT